MLPVMACAEPALRAVELYPFLACPNCKRQLTPVAGELACPQCGRRFPLHSGVPILLPTAVSFDPATAESVPQSAPGIARRVLTYGTHYGDNHQRLVELCQGGPIVCVGGGPKRDRTEYINLNIRPFPNVDIVGDAEYLPFTNNSLAGIVCNAVLEHVCHPWIVVTEFYRVLRPGGHIYIEVPFLQHFHASPDDYYRFTLHGTRELMSDFEPLDLGIACGPASTFVELTESFFMLAPLGRLRNVVKGATRLLLYPARIIERLLMCSSAAHTVANGFYFIGKKAAGSTD